MKKNRWVLTLPVALELVDADGALVAAGQPLPPGRVPFKARMVVEGVATGDGRYIERGALTWRDLPLPKMAQTAMPETGGHSGAELVGQTTDIARVGDEIWGRGSFADTPEARAIAQMVLDGDLKGCSVDLDALEVTYDESQDLTVLTKGRIMGDTLTPFPAFQEAFTAIDFGDGTPVGGFAATPCPGCGAMVPGDATDCPMCGGQMTLDRALAAAATVAPPRAWFCDPELDGPTPLTITEDGRVFGHIAQWGTCHIGISGGCVTPPTSPSAYAYFRTGSVLTAEGDQIPVGTLTIGCGHAGTSLGFKATIDHYDNAGRAWADVAAGEDAFGIWVAGAVAPDVDELTLHRARATAPSGDWRTIAGSLELVAVLSVNVPGFPVRRDLTASVRPLAGFAEDGRQVSLVAAGIVGPASDKDVIACLTKRIEDLEATIDTFAPLLADHYARLIGM